MAIIKSGNSNDLLSVDTTSKAARVTEYFPDGTPRWEKATGKYSARIVLTAPSATDGLAIWAMQNTGTREAKVSKIRLDSYWANTAANATSRFAIVRFSGSIAGGADVPIAKMASLDSSPSVALVKEAMAGLTVTGVSFDSAPVDVISILHYPQCYSTVDIVFPEPLVLRPGEGLAIRNFGAVGGSIFGSGSVYWRE